MNNSAKIHSSTKDLHTYSLVNIITKLLTSSTLKDIKLNNIIEAYQQGAVAVDDGQEDVILIKYPNNTYSFIDLGMYVNNEADEKFYSIDAVDELEDEIIEDYLESLED